MITSILQGGLGNQMFQYAFGLATARRLGVKLQLDATRLTVKRPFNLAQFVLPGLTTCTREEPTIVEQGMSYNQALVDRIKDGDVLQGYWQCEKYFENTRDELKKIFVPSTLSDRTIPVITACIMEPSVAAIHVRRGDYLVEPHKSFHGVLSDKYYADAIERILDVVGFHTRFFLFSDDIDWVKKNFGSERFTFVEPGLEAEDIFVMSLCHHIIIANSSFSWWGAYLGDTNSIRNRTVIAPKKWFDKAKEDYSDIVPERWIKI